MTGFWILLAWVLSLLIGTYLGYERGRWLEGMLLGLLGPLGAIAAGLLKPSLLWEAQRRYIVACHMAKMRTEAVAELRHRREDARHFDDMVVALEEQVHGQKLALSDGLDSLASELGQIAEGETPRAESLRKWSAWLAERSQLVRRHTDPAESD